MAHARAIQIDKIKVACRIKAADLIEREMMGEDVSEEKTALQAIDPRTSATEAKTPKELKAIWPTVLES